MKKLILIILFTIVAFVGMNAQRLLAEPRHYVGVKGGVVMSTVSFVPSISQSMHYSYQAGAVYRMVSEKYFGIQVEANYTQRGWNERNGYKRTLGYVEVPFLAHITFGWRVFRMYVNLGPSVSFLAHENNVLEDGMMYQQKTPVDNIVDYSIMGGVGFEFHTQAGVWSLEGRYSYGLGDIYNNSASDTFRGSSNQNIYVTLGWMFQVK